MLLASPAPEVDGSPVSDIKQEKHNWENTQKYQIRPGESVGSDNPWNKKNWKIIFQKLKDLKFPPSEGFI